MSGEGIRWISGSMAWHGIKEMEWHGVGGNRAQPLSGYRCVCSVRVCGGDIDRKLGERQSSMRWVEEREREWSSWRCGRAVKES